MVYRARRPAPVVLSVFLFLALLLALSASPLLSRSVQAAEPRPEAAEAALAWLRTQQGADGGFAAFGGESDPSVSADVAYAFAAAGVHPDAVVAASGASLLDYLLASAGAQTDNPGRAAKLALAFRIAGLDPRSAGGVDLIAAIEAGFDPATGWHGDSFYGHTLAVLALAATGAELPPAALAAIVAAQTPEGSWGFNGDPTAGTGDSNTTAMAIQALVTAGGDADAIERGLAYLRTLQNAEDGSISYDSLSVGDPGGDANSTALAIQAFVAAGQDPATLPHGDLLEALLGYQNPSGAFQFQPAFPDDSLLATAQAVPALLLAPFPYLPLPAGDPLANAAAPAAPRDGCVHHAVTQHNVCAPFAAYWEAGGGLAIYGYPLTEPVELDGLLVQYFERARFEWHPANAGTPWEVLLTRLGADQALLDIGGDPDRAVPAAGECRFFDATQHNVCGGFRAYWETQGGLATFGYPLTEELTDDGIVVQYFERARFEWHPGAWPERYDVLLTRLGAEALERELAR